MAQPIYIKAVNALGRSLAHAGVNRPELRADRLMESAVKKTGLADFGDESYLPGLDMLVEELRERADLSQIGRVVAYLNLLDHLCVRLRLIDYRAQRPAVAKQSITQPLFILGLPRTGTTILFELIAQDPAFRSPATWEVSRPLPPPQQGAYSTDTRIESVDWLLSWMERLCPGFRVIHALGARLPQECVYLLASNFVSEQFGYMYKVPAYRDWALQQDMTAAYQWHAHFLQHLQVDYAAQRWVLKTPAHLAYLKFLLAQYPDAAIVWTHRRPLDAIASFSSLTSTLRSGFSDVVDPVATGDYEFRHFASILDRGMADRRELDKGQFFDISFADICRNPIAVIERLYDHYGWELSGHAVMKMQEYLQRHPRNLYGEHKYSWGEYGLSESAEEHLYGEYLSQYGPGVFQDK